MESPPQSPTYQYPSRCYPYQQVNLSKAHTTPSCLPPAPPPSATTPSESVGEYFFPFASHSPAASHHSDPSTPNTTNTTRIPSTFPPMPRRSSFNYVHDLADFNRTHPPPITSESEEEVISDATPPTTPKPHHRPRRLSLKSYLPLGRLPLVHPHQTNPYESDSAISEENAVLPSSSIVTPPASPHKARHHRRRTTSTLRTPGPRLPHDSAGEVSASGMSSHNCFNSEDMKHLQHVRMLVGEAVEAFQMAGEERRRRGSFGGEGLSFTATPARQRVL